MALSPALFTSARSDDTDPSLIQPSHWNRVTGLLTSLLDGADAHGSLLYRDTADVTDGASWLPDVAAGSVLVSGGVGVAPAWSATPSLSGGLRIAGPSFTGSYTPYLFHAHTPSSPFSGVVIDAAGNQRMNTSLTVSGNPFLELPDFVLGKNYMVAVSSDVGASDPSVLILTSNANGGPHLEAYNGTTSAGVLRFRLANDGGLSNYNVFTDASNYERGVFQWTSNVLNVGTQAAGTGSGRALALLGVAGISFKVAAGATTVWTIDPNGHLIAGTDNARDIGASGATRPRNVYIAGLLTLSGGTLLATSAALTNGAAVQTGTLTNAPAAGNPTKWIPINDNGTTRYIPAW